MDHEKLMKILVVHVEDTVQTALLFDNLRITIYRMVQITRKYQGNYMSMTLLRYYVILVWRINYKKRAVYNKGEIAMNQTGKWLKNRQQIHYSSPWRWAWKTVRWNPPSWQSYVWRKNWRKLSIYVNMGSGK